MLLAYSARNRSASCRIPYATSPKAKRVEVRFPDAAGNPYLGFAAMLMAGLDGIRNKIHPGDPMDKDLYDLPPEELKGIPTVCGSLREAIGALEADHDFLLAGDVFSIDQIESYIELKWTEVYRFEHTPHPVEFEMYYSVVDHARPNEATMAGASRPSSFQAIFVPAILALGPGARSLRPCAADMAACVIISMIIVLIEANLSGAQDRLRAKVPWTIPSPPNPRQAFGRRLGHTARLWRRRHRRAPAAVRADRSNLVAAAAGRRAAASRCGRTSSRQPSASKAPPWSA